MSLYIFNAQMIYYRVLTYDPDVTFLYLVVKIYTFGYKKKKINSTVHINY